MSFFTRILGLVLITVPAPAVPQDEPRLPQHHAEWLAAHNLARSEVGIAPLNWSDRLAEDAQGWADHLAARDLYEHASPDQRRGQGENLWRGPRDRWSGWETVGFFIAEKRDFHPGNFPDVSHTGRWGDVAHYTQVIWPQTRELGCAIARTAHDEVLVCRYWPAGNIWGHRIDPADHIARR